jgi:hypothetical protein
MQLLCGRYMAAGKHVGKVLVQIRPEEDSTVVVPAPRLMQVHPQYFCNPIYSYIIAGTEFLCFVPKSREIGLCMFIMSEKEGWCSVVGTVTGLWAGQSGV